MRRNLISILLVVALVSVSQAQVSISGSIYDGAGGPLLMNVVYHAQDIDVPAGETLTIEAGCIIKMANTGTRFVVRGTLLANGTATNKIVLTSILDDTAGGDTAADGPTSGAPGQHQGVNFSPTSTASVANHMTVRFGGDQDLPGIRIVSSSCTLNSCIVEDCSKVGLELVGGETPNVSACGFDRCKVPIVLSNLDSLQGLLANTATNNSESNAIKYIGGTIATNSDVYSVNLIDGTLFWPNNMVVDENRKLTLHAGVIVKFGAPASRINLGGAFICLGTQSQPVVLTTLTDDFFWW